jgi:membrane protease YdiL (CAAX protease family)
MLRTKPLSAPLYQQRAQEVLHEGEIEMEMLVIAAIAFAIALVVRRKEAFVFRWQPTRATWVAVGTGLLAFAFSASLLLFEAGSTAAKLIHYGAIYVGCGVLIPWGYTLLVERAAPAAMGLKREGWLLSLIVNVILAGLFSLVIIFEADLAAINWGNFARAAVVLNGAGGLFELFLYYGFIHLRLKKAFSFIPAILGTSALYVLWHTGTQLPLETDKLAAVVKLFAVGVLYQSVFSITTNLLVIWPFFHGVGVMIDFAVNIGEVERVAVSFPWAVGAVVVMAIVGVVLNWSARRH